MPPRVQEVAVGTRKVLLATTKAHPLNSASAVALATAASKYSEVAFYKLVPARSVVLGTMPLCLTPNAIVVCSMLVSQSSNTRTSRKHGTTM